MARPKREDPSSVDRGLQREVRPDGSVRIWWNNWVATIRSRDKKVMYNHLHDLTYYASRGSEQVRCRCGEEVPGDLINMANLQKFKMGEIQDG
jgi:hypothetical protein